MTVQRVPGGSRGRSAPPFLRRLLSLVARLAYRLGANRSKTLLLTTVGARSGREHTSPVGYFPDGADAWLVVASMGGSRGQWATFRTGPTPGSWWRRWADPAGTRPGITIWWPTRTARRFRSPAVGSPS